MGGGHRLVGEQGPVGQAQDASRAGGQIRSWVTSTRVVPNSSFIRLISSITVAPVTESRLPVGSSAKSSSGGG